MGLIILALAGAVAHAAPLTVAVCDFKGDTAAWSYGNKVATLVTAYLATGTNLVLVDREQLRKSLNEQAFGASGMVSPETAAKIGHITGAKVLVSGQVLKTGEAHLVIIANIIGTETGRLFADKVEGAADNLTDLTESLSRKIAQTITAQATNLISAPTETHDEWLARIVQSIKDTNRPAISINIIAHNQRGNSWKDWNVANELGLILLKAGFPVVDAKSDNKPDIEITGDVSSRVVKQGGGLSSGVAALQLKVTKRRTGEIIAIEHQDGTEAGPADNVARKASVVNVTDALAERILPLLAK